jgi:hypothetical protein
LKATKRTPAAASARTWPAPASTDGTPRHAHGFDGRALGEQRGDERELEGPLPRVEEEKIQPDALARRQRRVSPLRRVRRTPQLLVRRLDVRVDGRDERVQRRVVLLGA